MDENTKNLQDALLHCGHYPGSCDGKMGPNTKKAIKGFQEQNGLDSDGIAGPQTKMVLATRLAEASTRVTELIGQMSTSITG